MKWWCWWCCSKSGRKSEKAICNRNQFSAHKSNKNGRNLNFKSNKCKVNWFNQNPIEPLFQSECVEQSLCLCEISGFWCGVKYTSLNDPENDRQSHSTMEHKIRMLIDSASRARKTCHANDLSENKENFNKSLLFRDKNVKSWFHFYFSNFSRLQLAMPRHPKPVPRWTK